MSGENELLEYETEAREDELVHVIEAVPVYLSEPVVTIPTVPQHVTCSTVVVATGTTGMGGPGVDQLLPLDPLRVRATVWCSDQAVVICHSRQQAGDAYNTAAGVPAPNGTYLPTGLPIPIQGTQQIWVAATSATPARVSVVVERRSP